jgi:hypothetical protein
MQNAVEYSFPVNLITLQNAVLCANCDVISESRNGHCIACGSPSLISLSRVLGRGRLAEREFFHFPLNAIPIHRVA